MPGRRRPPSLVAVVGALLLALTVGSDSHAFLRAVKPPPGESAAPAASDPPAPANPANAASDPRSTHQARQAVERHDFYDAANPDRERLQRIEEATRQLPDDGVGFPDWMRALRDKQIVPRYSVRGEARPELLDLDIVMRNTREMPHVRFPHLSHTLWLACSNCHPAPFKAEKGSNSIRMADIFRGQYCGMCHDRVAFVTFFSCNRCHSVPASAGETAR